MAKAFKKQKQAVKKFMQKGQRHPGLQKKRQQKPDETIANHGASELDLEVGDLTHRADDHDLNENAGFEPVSKQGSKKRKKRIAKIVEEGGSKEEPFNYKLN